MHRMFAHLSAVVALGLSMHDYYDMHPIPLLRTSDRFDLVNRRDWSRRPRCGGGKSGVARNGHRP